MMVDPASLPERDSYRLMISAFVPRPIAVLPSRVAESPVNFECRLIRAVTVADNTVLFGEAVRLHVDDAVMTQGLVDVHKAKPIGRLGGTQYCRTQDVFELRRPRITGPKAAGPTDAR